MNNLSKIQNATSKIPLLLFMIGIIPLIILIWSMVKIINYYSTLS